MTPPLLARRHRSYRCRVAGVALVCGCLSGCRESTGSPEILRATVGPEMVTGAAAAARGPDGRFVLPVPSPGAGQVSLDTARAQALEFARFVANNLNLRGVVEAGRGGYWTDPHLLRTCADPPYVVRPQVEAAGLDGFPAQGQQLWRRRLGPQWLIGLCGTDGRPQMTVQVAMTANPVRFLSGGLAAPDPFLLSAFSPEGVPLNSRELLPISAEQAVRFAFQLTGARIRDVPELFVRGDVDDNGNYVLQAGVARRCARWRLGLERAVTFQEAVGRPPMVATDVFVSALSCQSSDTVPVLQIPTPGGPSSVRITHVDFGSGSPTNYSSMERVASPIKFTWVHPVAPPR